jgi:hypothetical protein
MVHLWCNIQQQTLFCISLSWSIMDEHYNMWSFTKLWDIYCMKYQWHQDSLALSRCVAGWNCNQSVKTHCCNFRNTLVAQAYWRIRNQLPNGISETFISPEKLSWMGRTGSFQPQYRKWYGIPYGRCSQSDLVVHSKWNNKIMADMM